MSDKRNVFISYAWRDGKLLARQLYERFNAHDGWSAWMDSQLHADSIFSHELQVRIDTADLVVVIVSPDVNRHDPPSFVQKELAYATQKGVDKPVFAARAHECPVPLIVAGVTHVDFFGDADFEIVFQALVEKIQYSGRKPAVKVIPSSRERELAYLRGIAHDRVMMFAAKFYAELPAEASMRAEVDESILADSDVTEYLNLMMSVYTDKRHTPDEDSHQRRVETFDALTDALAKFDRVAIIGDPGSGKTTTLKRFAYILAEAAAQDESAPLPVFVPLGGYKGGDLQTYIESCFGGLRLADYLPGRVVVLLDGLNETAHENVESVQRWLDANPNVRVMLTCRKLDYVERRLDLQRVDVLPLDFKRIRAFVAAYKVSPEHQDKLFWGLAGQALKALWDKFQQAALSFDDFWFGDELTRGHKVYNRTGTQEEQLYNAMRAALRERDVYPGLLGLARNPFLLTITIDLYLRTRKIPENRAELFERFVGQLFEQRGKPAAAMRPPWIAEDEQRTFLARLAYRMQAEGHGTQIPVALARETAGQDAGHLLYLAASAGIIETGANVRFSHQLLQEYFAAHEMAEDLERGVPASKYWPGDAWWQPTGWEETAILLAGMTGDSTNVVRWLAPVNPTLAYRCATESGAPCHPDVLETLYEPPLGARIDPIARAEGGRRMAERGDGRKGVGVVVVGTSAGRRAPDIDWVEIPKGDFIYQDDQKLTLPTFYIARYPITYAQFQAFLDAPDGFDNDEWWHGLALQKQEMGEQAFPYANHPRERVSWYQAVAFCRWLTAKYHSVGAGLRPAMWDQGWEIRLPTEQEWEKVARGVDGRVYPWGNDYIPGYANIDETYDRIGPYYLARTTAVGLYPQGASPYGVLDMSGNVWEWCMNEYEHPERTQPEGDARRVLRGGSWNNVHGSARAAIRYNLDPFIRNAYLGFRVVCLLSPISRIAGR